MHLQCEPRLRQNENGRLKTRPPPIVVGVHGRRHGTITNVTAEAIKLHALAVTPSVCKACRLSDNGRIVHHHSVSVDAESEHLARAVTVVPFQ
jgi:hypothetical protein